MAGMGVFRAASVLYRSRTWPMPQKEIHRSGPRFRERIADYSDFGGKVREIRGGGVLDPEGHPHRSRNADRHRATYDHVANHGRDLFIAAGENVGFFVRKPGLVEKADAFGRPLQGRNHVTYSLSRGQVAFSARDRPKARQRHIGAAKEAQRAEVRFFASFARRSISASENMVPRHSDAPQ